MFATIKNFTLKQITKNFYGIEEHSNYYIINDTIIFKYHFDGSLDQYAKKISRCSKIIFANNKTITFFDTKNINFVNEQLCTMEEYNIFNDTIDYLPIPITHLKLGDKFNKSVDNLPVNLRYLFFGIYFNKSVDNLPLRLEYLSFGYYFNMPIDNLPIELKYLYLEGYFNHTFDYLPSSIIYLNLSCHILTPLNNLPNGIKILKLTNCYTNNYNDNYNNRYNHLDLNNLPNSIISLYLPIWFGTPIKHFPSKLKFINCSWTYPDLFKLLFKYNCGIINFVPLKPNIISMPLRLCLIYANYITHGKYSKYLIAMNISLLVYDFNEIYKIHHKEFKLN